MRKANTGIRVWQEPRRGLAQITLRAQRVSYRPTLGGKWISGWTSWRKWHLSWVLQGKSWSWKKVGEGQPRQKHRWISNAISFQKYKQFISQAVLGELKLKGKTSVRWGRVLCGTLRCFTPEEMRSHWTVLCGRELWLGLNFRGSF